MSFVVESFLPVQNQLGEVQSGIRMSINCIGSIYLIVLSLRGMQRLTQRRNTR